MLLPSAAPAEFTNQLTIADVEDDDDLDLVFAKGTIRSRVGFCPGGSASSKAWSSYLVRVVPAQYLIDSEGNVVARWSGKIDWEEVENEILRLLTPGSS